MLQLDPDDPDDEENKLVNVSLNSASTTSTILNETDHVSIENYKV